jgi:hypothetical protein
MSQAARRRRQRCRDFERRAFGFGFGSCFERHASRGWRYVRVHLYPGEEPEELPADLQAMFEPGAEEYESVEPERRYVDAYWECNGDIHFVQIEPGAEESSRPMVGLYGRWRGNEIIAYNLVVRTNGCLTSKVLLESAMEQLAVALPTLCRTKGLARINVPVSSSS